MKIFRRCPIPARTAILEALRELVLEEIKRRSLASVRDLCASGPDAEAPSPALLGFLARHRAEVAAWLDEATPSPGWPQSPARFLAIQTVLWLQGRNQFLEIDAAKREALDALYHRALGTTAGILRGAGDEGEIGAALSRLLADCRRGLASFVLELDRASGVPGFVFREVISSEYSASLQRSILGLEGAALSEPILDLGCGAGAHLVHALRREGRLAFGVDRFAEEGEYVFSGDWLDWPLGPVREPPTEPTPLRADLGQSTRHNDESYPKVRRGVVTPWMAQRRPARRPSGALEQALRPGAWGTILSHQGFSNHFLHQHLRTGGEASRYARRYMEILGALKPGGAFVYAPGLPFIEDLLPGAGYQVTRRPIPLPAGAPEYAPGSPLGLSAYACRVERRAP